MMAIIRAMMSSRNMADAMAPPDTPGSELFTNTGIATVFSPHPGFEDGEYVTSIHPSSEPFPEALNVNGIDFVGVPVYFEEMTSSGWVAVTFQSLERFIMFIFT